MQTTVEYREVFTSTEDSGIHLYWRVRVRDDFWEVSWVAEHVNWLLKLKRIRVRVQDLDFIPSINGEMLGLAGF